MVTWPHFGDQGINSDLLLEAGVAVALCKFDMNRLELQPKDQRTYTDSVFDAEKVYEVFNEVLTNPKYKKEITNLSV